MCVREEKKEKFKFFSPQSQSLLKMHATNHFRCVHSIGRNYFDVLFVNNFQVIHLYRKHHIPISMKMRDILIRNIPKLKCFHSYQASI